MPDAGLLPHLMRLLDDDTPVVRQAVRRELGAFGTALEPALDALDPPPTDQDRRLIRSLIEEEERRARVHFEPGDLVRHMRYGYRGVVVAFDPECKADLKWYLANRTQPDRDQPWYHVLVDGVGRVTYTAETSLESDDSTAPVRHPLVRLFFDGFEGNRHLRNDRPWPGAE